MIYFSLANYLHYAIGFPVPVEARSTSRDEVDSKFDTGLARVDKAKSRFSSSSLTSYNDTSVMSAFQFTVPTSSPQSSCQRLRPAPVTRGQSLRLSAWGTCVVGERERAKRAISASLVTRHTLQPPPSRKRPWIPTQTPPTERRRTPLFIVVFLRACECVPLSCSFQFETMFYLFATLLEVDPIEIVAIK